MMKILGPYTVVFVILFSFSSTPAQETSSAFEEQQCQFPHKVGGENPGVFWAQELVGADLLREELKEQGGFTFEDVAGMIGIWDASVRTHGEFVSNLIAGPHASAVIPLDEPLSYDDLGEVINGQINYVKKYGQFYRECHRTGNCPTYINNSMHWPAPTIANTASMMSSRGSTLITIAGNRERPVYSEKNTTAENQRTIVVASLDLLGFPSGFTSYNDGVTISAPADNHIRSYNFAGEPKTFGGTSGSTPLVTGALGGFSLLSHYSLATHEARHLLMKTAIPIPSLPESHLVGAGMLNAYKMGRVALRLKEQCKQYPPGFRSRYECMADALRTEQVYRFEKESILLTNEAVEAFPECSSVEENVHNAPPHAHQCKRMESFHNLRKAAFLDSQNKKAWEVLACVKTEYFNRNYSYLFYQNLAQRVGKDDEEILRDICQAYRPIQQWQVRYLSESSLMDLLEQDDCRPEVLAFTAEHIYPSSNYIQNMDELLEKIIRHPQTRGRTLEILPFTIGRNIDKINNLSMILDAFFSHPQMSGYALQRLITALQSRVDSIPDAQIFVEQILTHPKGNWRNLVSLARFIGVNFEKISNAEIFLERILEDPNSNEATLINLIRSIGNNFDKMANARSLLNEFLNDSRVNGRILSVFVESIVANPEKFVDSTELLGNTLDHSAVDSNMLNTFIRRVGNNIETIANSRQLLDKALAHEKVNQTVLNSFTNMIGDNTDKIANFWEFLEEIFTHPVTSKRVLKTLTVHIGNHFDSIPEAQEFLARIFADERIDGEILMSLVRSVEKNAHKMVNPREFLGNIFRDPRANQYTLRNFIHWIVGDESSIVSNSWEFLEEIFIHPSMNSYVLSIFARSVGDNANKLPNYRKIFDDILAHPGANNSVLISVVHSVERNVWQISNFWEILDTVLVPHRLEVNRSVLNALSKVIPQNADKIPDFQELFDKFLNHREVNGGVLASMARSISDNVDKFSNPMESLDNILNHPRINKITLDVMLNMARHSNKIPHGEELAQRIENHPKYN